MGVHGNPECEGRQPGVARTGRLRQAAFSLERERQTVSTVRERDTIFHLFMSAVSRRPSICVKYVTFSGRPRVMTYVMF